MSGIVTLTTDFGTEDAYAGTMKGVILSINPQAQLVDLTHSVAPQRVLEGSYMLATAFRYFPKGTVHLAVVDPGVGSARRALAVQAGGYFFVAPDNGILSHVLAVLGLAHPGGPGSPTSTNLASGMRAVALTNPAFWLHPVSATFHGRDIFSPVAARLSLGHDLTEFGEDVPALLLYPLSSASTGPDGSTEGTVVHVDHFGNLVTDIRVEALPSGPVEVRVAGRVIRGLSLSYADAAVDPAFALLAIEGSEGYLDLAVRDGNAAALLGIGVGEPVRVKPAVTD